MARTDYLAGENGPVQPLQRFPIGFAHRGGRAHAPDNTLEAFEMALRLGANGLESDCWLTSDGVVVLDHDGVVRAGRRKRLISDIPRSALPATIPSLADLYARCGTAFELSLDVKDPAAGAPTIAAARDAGVEHRLWLCSGLEVVAGWRSLSETVCLVDSTRLRHIREGAERRAARQLDLGVDAVNLHHSDWSLGLVTLWHRFGRYALGWDAQQPRVLDDLLKMGVDGVFSDHVDRMVDAMVRHSHTRAEE